MDADVFYVREFILYNHFIIQMVAWHEFTCIGHLFVISNVCFIVWIDRFTHPSISFPISGGQGWGGAGTWMGMGTKGWAVAVHIQYLNSSELQPQQDVVKKRQIQPLLHLWRAGDVHHGCAVVVSVSDANSGGTSHTQAKHDSWASMVEFREGVSGRLRDTKQ